MWGKSSSVSLNRGCFNLRAMNAMHAMNRQLGRQMAKQAYVANPDRSNACMQGGLAIQHAAGSATCSRFHICIIHHIPACLQHEHSQSASRCQQCSNVLHILGSQCCQCQWMSQSTAQFNMMPVKAHEQDLLCGMGDVLMDAEHILKGSTVSGQSTLRHVQLVVHTKLPSHGDDGRKSWRPTMQSTCPLS